MSGRSVIWSVGPVVADCAMSGSMLICWEQAVDPQKQVLQVLNGLCEFGTIPSFTIETIGAFAFEVLHDVGQAKS